MSTSTEAVIAMRDAGRSWTEIRERLGVPVPLAREIVDEARAKRRRALAHSEVRERANGLLDECGHCQHVRKDHDSDGHCAVCGPERVGWSINYRLANESDYRHESLSHPTESMPRPQRPSACVGMFYALPEDLGCGRFETAEQIRDRRADWLAGHPRRGRHPNDLVNEAIVLGVDMTPTVGSGRWNPGGAHSTASGPTLKHRVRRARRRAERGSARTKS